MQRSSARFPVPPPHQFIGAFGALVFTASLLATCAGIASSQSVPPLGSAVQGQPPAGLDAYIEASMAAWGVAGLSIAIVKDDQVILARGYGVSDVRTGQPVDDNTVFAIGSMTKPLTALAAGRLVDQGKLSWDDLLIRHVRGFAVGDAYVSGAATVRDALTHQTGFDWSIDPLMLTAASPMDVIEAVAQLQPAYPFRRGFNYSNIMYLIASQAVAEAAGTDWDSLMEDLLITPLGLQRSVTSSSTLDTMQNVATPHRNHGDGPQPIARGRTAVVLGAGAMSGSVRDMAVVLQMMARGGTLADGTRFLEPETFEEVLTPQVNIGVAPGMRVVSNFHAYGMGWEVMDYKGRKVALHGGAIDGMLSQMAVVPADRLGIVVLTNTDGARYLPDAIVLTLLDRYLGGVQTDWNESKLRSGLGIRSVIYGTPERRTGTRPTLDLESYAGSYTGPLGSILITHGPRGLAFEYGELKGPLVHWHYDTFRGHFGSYSDRLVTFALGSQGLPDRMNIEFVGEFKRQPR